MCHDLTEGEHFIHSGKVVPVGGLLLLVCWSSWVSPHAVLPFHRARGSVTAQGLPGGDVWPDRHQLADIRGLEGSAHGGHDMNMGLGGSTSRGINLTGLIGCIEAL